jgi:hypothetical protein
MDPRRQSHHPSAVLSGWKLPVRILIGLLIILSACGVIYFGSKAVTSALADSTVKGSQFQAVFLTNGQVYFGKLSHVSDNYVKLTNIFYLQVNNNGSTTQPSTGSSNQTSVQPSADSNQQVSLAKLGNELHGPEDTMYVSRSQVLFWENLKTSGKVTQAIRTYQKANQ